MSFKSPSTNVLATPSSPSATLPTSFARASLLLLLRFLSSPVLGNYIGRRTKDFSNHGTKTVWTRIRYNSEKYDKNEYGRSEVIFDSILNILKVR